MQNQYIGQILEICCGLSTRLPSRNGCAATRKTQISSRICRILKEFGASFHIFERIVPCFMRIIVCLFFLLNFFSVQAQLKEPEMRALLLTKLADNIEWPKSAVRDSFVFGITTKDTAFIKTFRQINKKRTIHQRALTVKRITNMADIAKCNAMYIGSDENYRADKYWEAAEGYNVLIITQDLANMLFSMINIDYSESHSTFSFVINKTNITIAGLNAMPSLLLAGGEEVDVRQLYKSTKEQLEKEQAKADQQKKMIETQLKKIASLDEQLERQASMLNKQLDVIHGHESKIEMQTQKLQELNERIASREDSIARNKYIIQSQTDIITRQERFVGQKESELERLNGQLKMISAQIHDKQEVLSLKESQLIQKEEVISSQKIFLWLAMAGICFAGLTISFVYYAYRSKSEANRRLDEKNLVLERQQDEIQKQSSELQTMNQELQLQSDELQEALNKLTETQAQLIQAEKMASLGTLTAGIAHEINNPINFVTTGIEGLKSAIEPVTEIMTMLMKLPEEAYKHQQMAALMNLAGEIDILETTEGIWLMIKNIETGAERASEIVRGLNNFSRSRDTEPAPMDIRQSIESTLLLLNSEIKNRIKVQKMYGQIPQVKCLPGKINQVLMNILSNAVQAISLNGTITVITEMSGNEHIKIRIRDTGKGISEQDLPRIFEPFYTTKSVGKGTGLGLAISYSIVQQHNGSIDVRSERGVGTEFTIKLPINAKLS